RELHDGLIQELAGMAMDLGRRAGAPHVPGELKQDLQSLQSRVIKAAEIARHVAYELHPSELDDLGLEKAMRAYCQQIAGENGIAVDFKCRKIPAELNRETASCLYKVAQEALRNVAKHAHAKQAQVVLESADNHIRLSISDGGKGFDVSLLQGVAGLGVASMRERVQLCNGKFNIASQRGNGTEVTAELPLRQPGKAK
ncbi:MAG TPA: sensor histidine kinase, partial [Bryobacteraceae bacterium]